MSRNFIDTYGYLVRHLITGVEAAGYWPGIAPITDLCIGE
jgi:hypothetical protein